jgi:2-iminobutanoate/2-iminopropanoate deaminase
MVVLRGHRRVRGLPRSRAPPAPPASWLRAGTGQAAPQRLRPWFQPIGGFVFSGAITGRDPDTAEMPPDLDTRCVNVFRHVRQIVEAAGCSTDDIGKMTVWLRDVGDRSALNRQWEAMFPDPGSRPARHAIAATFDGEVLIQRDFIAVDR